MKISILSSLFPPDVGTPAPYVQELTTRLAANHDISLLIYGYLPESVGAVPIQAIDKRGPLILRLVHFTTALYRQSKADLLIVNNAPAVELPVLFFRLFRSTPILLLESDPIALRASTHGIYKYIHQFLLRLCTTVIQIPSPDVYTRAERLPFVNFDMNKEGARLQWWEHHLSQIKI